MLTGVVESVKALEGKLKEDPNIWVRQEFRGTPRLLELSEALLELISGKGSLL
jgi:hypothetical protein